jgi:hypothetical protein
VQISKCAHCVPPKSDGIFRVGIYGRCDRLEGGSERLWLMYDRRDGLLLIVSSLRDHNIPYKAKRVLTLMQESDIISGTISSDYVVFYCAMDAGG